MNLRQNDTAFMVEDGTEASDLTISSVIGNGGSGNNAMIKNGAGRMTLSGANSFAGNITVNGDTLAGNNTGGDLRRSARHPITPVNGDLFFILNNDGKEAITGTFNGLAEGSTFTDNLSSPYQITYGADFGNLSFTVGNDVALMAIPEPCTALLGCLSLVALLRRRR